MLKVPKYMRGYSFFILIITSIALSVSCSKLNDSTEMNLLITPPSPVSQIATKTSIDTGQTFATIPIRFNLDSIIQLQNKRLSSKNISSTRLNNFVLTITDVDTAITFANYEQLRIFIDKDGRTSNLLASLNPSDAKVKTLNIPVTATDNPVGEFINDGQFRFLIKGKLRRSTTAPSTIRLNSSFRVLLAL